MLRIIDFAFAVYSAGARAWGFMQRARWQIATPMTFQIVYAVADDVFNVTPAVQIFYSTSHPSDHQPGKLRQYLQTRTGTQASKVTITWVDSGKMYIACVDLEGARFDGGEFLNFSSMTFNDLRAGALEVKYDSDLVDVKLPELSEEIPDLEDFDFDSPAVYDERD